MGNIFSKSNDSSSREVSSNRQVPFAVVEAYKTIRTNLVYAMSQSDKHSFVVSSSNQGEGKSTTSVNIAIAFSQLGSRVLLVDADLRMPTIYKKMKLSNSEGLTSILAGLGTFEEAVHKVNTNLDVLTSGPIPPNPSELLSSVKMDSFLEMANNMYDYIIIDTPPANIVSDAVVLAPKTAGAVIVVHGKSTTHEQLDKTVSSLKFADVRLLGVVINGGTEKGKGTSYSEKYGV